MLRKLVKSYLQHLWDFATFERWKVILSLLEPNPNAVLLSCGCYEGSSTIEVAKRVGTNKIYGIDIIDEALEKARKKGIIAYKSDLNEPFPIKSESIDVVCGDQIIEHLHNLDNFIGEIYRVLKAGGYGIISTENLASWHNILALILGHQPFSGPAPSTKFIVGWHPLRPKPVYDPNDPTGIMPKHDKVLAFKALKRIFAVYGFTVVKLIGVGYYVTFPKALGRALSRLDGYHSMFLVIRVKKPC